jgi:hypothetical protein
MERLLDPSGILIEPTPGCNERGADFFKHLSTRCFFHVVCWDHLHPDVHPASTMSWMDIFSTVFLKHNVERVSS